MSERFLKHGSFSWFDLTTTDVEAARRFYAGLFGWETERMVMEGGMVYHVVKVDGEPAGGIMAASGGDGETPPVWSIYVTVKDVDATAMAVREMGGRVLVGPEDIPRVGRFCVFQDPQGAVLSAITYRPMEKAE